MLMVSLEKNTQNMQLAHDRPATTLIQYCSHRKCLDTLARRMLSLCGFFLHVLLI